MKTRIILFTAIIFLSCSIANSKDLESEKSASPEGSLNVIASADLYNLTLTWANEYKILHPEVKINVKESSDNSIKDWLNGEEGGIAFISQALTGKISDPSIWKIVVGRDVIVPVMNARNPHLDEICRKGITPNGLFRTLENQQSMNWGILAQNGNTTSLHFYITGDESVKAGVAGFLNDAHLNTSVVNIVRGNEIISAIQQDPNSFGFCKLSQVSDLKNQSLVEGIKLVPIDKNGNGKIDCMENVYDNLQTFSRGVWIGKYLNLLADNIYSVSAEKPTNETEIAYLNWVLKDGQQYLNSGGFSDLVYSERLSQLEKINEPEICPDSQESAASAFGKVIIWFLIGIGLIGFSTDLIIRWKSRRESTVQEVNSKLLPVFDEDSVIVPRGIYFDKTHTWAFMKKDGMVKIGVDDFIQHVIGRLTRIEMRNIGDQIRKGDRLLTLIRKGKQLNIYSPVSGTITAQNQSLTGNSALINSDPYDKGWVYLIEPANWQLEIQFLTMDKKYRSWLSDEFTRLKDFFAATVNAAHPKYATVVLQDGGVLKDHLLADLGPEVWEDFQTNFIDTAC